MLYSFDNQQFVRFQQQQVKLNEPTDAQLLSGVATGSEEALNILSKRHTPLLRTIIARVINDDADVDEVVQDVMLEIWKNASHYSEDKGQALGWIVTLARRRAIDRVRRKQSYARAKDRYQAEVMVDVDDLDTNSADMGASASELKSIFARVLESLPDAQREALYLAYYNGLSQREIAATTGLPLGTIKTRLELAIRKVRSAILAQGGREEWMAVLMNS